jgi:UPF0755 protein
MHDSGWRQVLGTTFAVIELNVTRLKAEYLSALLALAVAFLAFWYLLLLPAPTFPAGHIVTIEEGQSLSSVANELHDLGLIRSPFLFKVLGKIRGAQVKAGKYVFAQPVGLLRVEERVQDGAFGIVPTKVTFIEGSTVRDMARTLKKAFPDFDADAFLAEAIPLEGYLYPDTYQFFPDVTPHEVVVRLYANFSAHEEALNDQIETFDKPLKDDLVMASLLEKEARGLEERRMVAGILWNRVKLGMPLQVDAVFGYINDRKTYDPSLSDLKTESAYNTYTNKGLPPGPIGNPSDVSILAAITPEKTDYLYYLTGRDGRMYYAKTFAEHKANRAKYLD